MAERIYKLSPHRDLQSYFLTPSAIAAMSQATDAGFVLSGKWRQQFDWAVVEWNRDNTFEHPALRYLPDGDLSGLTLSYEEERIGCIPFESNLVPVVDWDNLRIWASDANGTESIYHVRFTDGHITPMEGSYVPASATMTIVASPGIGMRVGVALLENHHYYEVQGGDSLADIARGVATAVTGNSSIVGNPDFSATSDGASVVIMWKNGGRNALYPQLLGANGNRVTVYGFAEGVAQVWQQPSAGFSGGQFPSKYQVSFDFGALKANLGIPTDRVRKLRWTWAADLQAATFQQTEFQVMISNWTVTGLNRQHLVAGPGSRRIEEIDTAVSYDRPWTLETGNYSGSKICWTDQQNDSCTITYSETATHELFLGTRRYASAANVTVSVDGQPLPEDLNLALNGEDVLVRLPLGSYAAGSHTVSLKHVGPNSSKFYFDFLEVVYPSQNLPDFPSQPQLALATDWDTYHSQSLPAERTAWLIQKLGFTGRVNHYAGALWFYELVRTGTQYASATVTLTPQAYTGSPTLVVDLTPAPTPDNPNPQSTSISHLILLDDTPATVAQALAGLINSGTNLVWASADGDELTITARAMGIDGNGISIQLDPTSQGYTLNGPSVLSGGVDGSPYGLDVTDPLNSTLIAAADYWRTDLFAQPRINRAARDWHIGYFAALEGYGIDAVASFSTELMNGDPSEQTGIAQRYPDGTPVVLNTPAIQTNFSPTALAFWTQTYLDMASLQSTGGMTPYLQSGEVQWWYFQKQIWDSTRGENVNVGMPFYDDYTKEQFAAKYGVAIQTITSNDANPSQYPNETTFLPSLIGTYTETIRKTLQAEFPECRYEVLYPTDTNNTALNQLINFPSSDWTPQNLNCLKTESFTFTGSYRLDLSTESMNVSAAKGFPSEQRSHLIGISDAWTSWMKEVDLAQSQGLESVVLFALDQYCLVGYPAPPFVKLIRSQRQG